MNVDVPVHFINEDKSPGLKRGGVLEHRAPRGRVPCPANAIPDFITVDLDGTDIGDSVHIVGGQRCRPERASTEVTLVPSCFSSGIAGRSAGSSGDGAGGRRGSGRDGLSRTAVSEQQDRGIRPQGRTRPGATSDAAFRRSRQSRPALRRQPAQCRLHGGGCDPPPPPSRPGANVPGRRPKARLGGEKVLLLKPQTS